MYRVHAKITADERGVSSGLARTIWANKKLNELETDPQVRDSDLIEHAKANQLVTDHTSLIVLEELEDYLEHDIRPPEELLKDWLKQRRDKQNQAERAQKDHLKEVVKLYKEWQKWWEKRSTP